MCELNKPLKAENKRLERGNPFEHTTETMNDNSRLRTDLEYEFYQLISKHKRTSMRELGFIFGLNSREVRKVIEQMRRRGVRIGSDYRGYYLCNSEKEFQEFLKSYTSQAMSILSIAKAMRENNNEQIYINK